MLQRHSIHIVITMGLAFLFAGSQLLGVVARLHFCLSAYGDVQSHVVRLGSRFPYLGRITKEEAITIKKKDNFFKESKGF